MKSAAFFVLKKFFEFFSLRGLKMGLLAGYLSKMKNGHISAIRFSTLAAICDVLKCQPGDILEYSPEEKITKF